MTIKEVSQKYDLSPDTIRYYERICLIPPVPRKPNGIRDFDQESCNWIEFIKCMRQTHMPISKLKEIAELYEQGRSTVLERKKIFIEHQENLIKQKELIDQALKTLDDKFKLLEKEGDY